MKADNFVAEAPVAESSKRNIDPMEQVRDLLFGEAKRSHDHRITELNALVNALEERIERRLEDLSKQLNDLRVAGRAEQDAAVNAIGEAIADVGRKITALKTHGG